MLPPYIQSPLSQLIDISKLSNLTSKICFDLEDESLKALKLHLVLSPKSLEFPFKLNTYYIGLNETITNEEHIYFTDFLFSGVSPVAFISRVLEKELIRPQDTLLTVTASAYNPISTHSQFTPQQWRMILHLFFTRLNIKTLHLDGFSENNPGDGLRAAECIHQFLTTATSEEK